jgi:16S rRNA (uracil1498-N3)-methyltransferase
MSDTRLFVPDRVNSGEALWLEGERSHYLSRVLRMRAGDTIVIFDGRGAEHACNIGEIARQRVQLVVGERSSPKTESMLGIRLIQGVSRGDRMDFVVQKSTELGVRRISPATTEYSVVRLDSGRSTKKTEHWSRIAQSACEQCGRTCVPLIDAPEELETLLAAPTSGSGVVLVPAAGRQLADLPAIDETVTLLVGPEGGLAESECALAVDRGFVPLSLGPRILRTETAALAAIAILQSRFGDLRSPTSQNLAG